jgi:hypothetical protein
MRRKLSQFLLGCRLTLSCSSSFALLCVSVVDVAIGFAALQTTQDKTAIMMMMMMLIGSFWLACSVEFLQVLQAFKVNIIFCHKKIPAPEQLDRSFSRFFMYNILTG